jgi:hypothetical protein
MNDSQLKLARAFHLTFSIDASHGICKIDNLAIMTITTKDAFGKPYVILRMWIPNQKTLMFRYVILDLIPAMIGVINACKVRAIVSDGDPQLIKVIDLAIAQKYRNAVRIPCAWHIIDRSLLKARREFHVKWNVSVY